MTTPRTIPPPDGSQPRPKEEAPDPEVSPRIERDKAEFMLGLKASVELGNRIMTDVLGAQERDRAQEFFDKGSGGLRRSVDAGDGFEYEVTWKPDESDTSVPEIVRDAQSDLGQLLTAGEITIALVSTQYDYRKVYGAIQEFGFDEGTFPYATGPDSGNSHDRRLGTEAINELHNEIELIFGLEHRDDI